MHILTAYCHGDRDCRAILDHDNNSRNTEDMVEAPFLNRLSQTIQIKQHKWALQVQTFNKQEDKWMLAGGREKQHNFWIFSQMDTSTTHSYSYTYGLYLYCPVSRIRPRPGQTLSVNVHQTRVQVVQS